MRFHWLGRVSFQGFTCSSFVYLLSLVQSHPTSTTRSICSIHSNFIRPFLVHGLFRVCPWGHMCNLIVNWSMLRSLIHLSLVIHIYFIIHSSLWIPRGSKFDYVCHSGLVIQVHFQFHSFQYSNTIHFKYLIPFIHKQVSFHLYNHIQMSIHRKITKFDHFYNS